MSKRGRKLNRLLQAASFACPSTSTNTSPRGSSSNKAEKEPVGGEKRKKKVEKKEKKRRRTLNITSTMDDTTTQVDIKEEIITDGEPGESSSSSSSSSESSYASDLDDELDAQLREEVERDIPPSITDLSLAERVAVRKVLIIWNPYAGNKRGKKVTRMAKRMLEREGIIVETIRLEKKGMHYLHEFFRVEYLSYHIGHAEELCETYDFDDNNLANNDDESGDGVNIDVLAAVGGDGTFHECVNGMMKRIRAGFVGLLPSFFKLN